MTPWNPVQTAVGPGAPGPSQEEAFAAGGGRWVAATHSPTPKNESQQVEHTHAVEHLLCPGQASARLFHVQQCELGA